MLVGWKAIAAYMAEHGGPASDRHVRRLVYAKKPLPVYSYGRGCQVHAVSDEIDVWLDLRRTHAGARHVAEHVRSCPPSSRRAAKRGSIQDRRSA